MNALMIEITNCWILFCLSSNDDRHTLHRQQSGITSPLENEVYSYTIHASCVDKAAAHETM